VPRLTSVAVEFRPLLVVSLCRQPTALAVLTAVPVLMPEMVKLREGSISARTTTDSIVARLKVERSRSLTPSVVLILTFQISAFPAVWLLFVGLIRVGT